MKKPSITDIAKRAGVSIASVSYVLNGREKEKRVGEDAANRIRQAAAELNYRPSHIARSLRQGSTMTIGLVVPDISNSYFGDMAKAIEEEAFRRGYTVIFGSSDENPEKSERLVQTLLDRQVDGIILAPVEEEETHITDLNERLPLVLIDRFIKKAGINYVALDNHQAAYQAVEHLAKRGDERIAFVGYLTEMNHITERYRGYKEAMAAFNAGFSLTGQVRYSRLDEDIETVLDGFYADPDGLDAIVFATNTLTVAGLYYFQRKQIRIPEELAVIGFDGNVAFDFFYSPLTYIKQPIQAIGKRAVEILLQQIDGKNQQQHQLHLLPELIERSST
ncbi:MAG: LacI family DNA-binding transcriptional regulator [Bacteroidota bacterium]